MSEITPLWTASLRIHCIQVNLLSTLTHCYQMDVMHVKSVKCQHLCSYRMRVCFSSKNRWKNKKNTLFQSFQWSWGWLHLISQTFIKLLVKFTLNCSSSLFPTVITTSLLFLIQLVYSTFPVICSCSLDNGTQCGCQKTALTSEKKPKCLNVKYSIIILFLLQFFLH